MTTDQVKRFATYQTKSGRAYGTLNDDSLEGLLPHLPLAFSHPDDDAAWAKARLHIARAGLPGEWEPARLCVHVLQDWQAESLPGRDAAIALDVPEQPDESPVHVMLVRDLLETGCRIAREMYDKAAKERQHAGQERGRNSKKGMPVNLPESKSDARDAVGKMIGVSGKTCFTIRGPAGEAVYCIRRAAESVS
jgi:hypothetical protein